jgi:hypothetical protein
MMSRSRLASSSARQLLAMLVLAGACAHGAADTRSGWQVVRTSHFAVYAPERVPDGVVQQLEDMNAFLGSTFFPGVALASTEVVFLGQGRPDFVPTCGRLRSTRSLVVLQHWNDDDDRCGTTSDWPEPGKHGYPHPIRLHPACRGGLCGGPNRVAHQLSHQFIEAKVPGAPAWLHEGLAQYLGLQIQLPDGKRRQACFGYEQPAERGTGVIVPLDELFAASTHQYDRSLGRWFEFTSWALVDYLWRGEGGRWRAGFPGLLDGLAGALSVRDAFTRAFPALPFAELDQRLRQHVRTFVPPAAACPVAFPLETAAPTIVERGTLSPARTAELTNRLRQLPSHPGHSDWADPAGAHAAATR